MELTPAMQIRANQAAILDAEIAKEKAEALANKLAFEKYLKALPRNYNRKYILNEIEKVLKKDPLRTYYTLGPIAYSDRGTTFPAYDPAINHIIRTCEKMGFQAKKHIGGHTAGGGSDPYYTSDSYELEIKITW